MKILTTTVARILYAVPMGIFGLLHFISGQQMTAIVPAWLPAPLFWVYLTGIVLLAACIFILFKIKYANIIAYLLALELLSFILFVHLPGVMSGSAQMMQMAMTNMLKDIALLGGALVFAGVLTKS